MLQDFRTSRVFLAWHLGEVTFFVHVSNEKTLFTVYMYLGDSTTLIINHDKDPYDTTSIVESGSCVDIVFHHILQCDTSNGPV